MLIILDRDGVINYDSVDYIKNPDEWIVIPNSLEAIAKLNAAGHTVVVATNQSGIGRGYYSLETLEKIHEKMRSELAKKGGHLDGIYFCPHTPEDHCECRKPKPGLFHKIAEDFAIDLRTAIAVGDSLRDLQAAQTANCPSVLVKTGNGAETFTTRADLIADIPVYEDLSAFVTAILKK